MATLQEMKVRIGREIGKPEIIPQISEAVASAILHYERKRFWFNETQTTAAVTLHIEQYALPANYIRDDYVQFISNNTQWRLEPVPYEWLAERDHTNPTFGQSSYYSIYRNKLWLWPVPDVSTYNYILSYIKKLPTLTDMGSNEFTTELERVVRARAKYYLAIDVLRDGALAQLMKAEELDALSEAVRETDQRATSGKMKAVYL